MLTNPASVMVPQLVVLAVFVLLLAASLFSTLAGLRVAARGQAVSGLTGAAGCLLLAVCSTCVPLMFSVIAGVQPGSHGPMDGLIELLNAHWFLVAWGATLAIATIAAVLHGASLWTLPPRRA